MKVELSWDEFKNILQHRVADFAMVVNNSKAGNVYAELAKVKAAVDAVLPALPKKRKR